jgi:hypothetical protein
VVAIVIAVLSMAFAGWTAYEGHRSADEARQANENTLDLFKWEHQPEVNLLNYSAITSPDGRHVDFRLTINNPSKSPLIRLQQKTIATCGDKTIGESFRPGADLAFPVSNGASVTCGVSVDLTAEQVAAVRERKTLLKVMVLNTFNSQFDKSPHYVALCAAYEPTLPPTSWAPCRIDDSPPPF